MSQFYNQQRWIQLHEDQCGTRFAAINLAIHEARHKMQVVSHPILDSEALSWVISGSPPESIFMNNSTDILSRIRDYVYDNTSYMSNIDIQEAVLDSILTSYEYGYLIYVYHDIPDVYYSKVRVATNKLWGSLYSEIL